MGRQASIGHREEPSREWIHSAHRCSKATRNAEHLVLKAVKLKLSDCRSLTLKKEFLDCAGNWAEESDNPVSFPPSPSPRIPGFSCRLSTGVEVGLRPQG